MVLHAAYAGCYVFQQADAYIMPLFIKRAYGPWSRRSPEVKELRCPKLEGLSGSSPDHCLEVPSRERIACGGDSEEMCRKRGCCWNGTGSSSCYYGKKVTVLCTEEGWMSIAISKHLTQLQLSSIHLENGESASCAPILRTDELVVFQFRLSMCGTTSREKDRSAIYENVVVADIKARDSNVNVTKYDSQLRLYVQCTFHHDIPTKTSTGVLTSPPLYDGTTIRPELQMRFAKDGLYQEYFADGEHSVVKLQHNSTIPIEVRIVDPPESEMTLILHQCWATPGEDSDDQPQWPVLMRGCPFLGEDEAAWYASPIGPHDQRSPSPYRRFIIYSNCSVNPPSLMYLSGSMFFHCHASVCLPNVSDPCVPEQHKRRQRSVQDPASNVTTILVSSHIPLYFPTAQDSDFSGKGSPEPSAPLEKKWVRIVIVVSVLTVVVLAHFAFKRRCKPQDDKM